MKALFYAGESDGRTKQLKSVLAEAVGKENIKDFQHIRDLVQYFARPRPADDLNIAVFAATDSENLQQVSSLRDIISSMRIILVLPDRNSKTIAEGHKLKPRFVAYRDSDFKVIGAVVEKMIESAS